MSGQQGPWVVFVRRQNAPSVSVPSLSSLTSSSSSAATPSAAQTGTSTSVQSTSSEAATTTSTSNAGTIAGSVIGGVAFLVLAVLGILLYLRARKRKRTPPSSEFMNSLKTGATPVLRLESGAGYTPTLAEKRGGYTHYPAVPLPLMQDSYSTTPPSQNMGFPDEMTTTTDSLTGRPSIETPLHSRRFSSQQRVNDSSVAQHRPSTSAGSRRELWASLSDLPPVHEAESVLQFAPRVSLDEPSTQPPRPPHSLTLLQPLRRQPDPESPIHV